MKKTGLFKIIMFTLLGIVLVTWLFSASYFSEGAITELGMYNIGFFDYFQLLFGSFEFQYFIQIFILLISIGALYGVLGKTGKYRAMVEKIAANFKGAEIAFLIIAAIIIAAITSVFDYGFALFIFIPFIISIILAMGYDKITACATTFGAILIGTIGSTVGYNTSGVVNDLLKISASTGVIFKIAIFVLSMIALIFYLSRAKVSRAKKDEDVADMFIGEKISNKYSVAPVIIVFCILFVLLVLGCTNWEKTFGVEFFTNLNDTITTFTVKLPYFHITTDGLDYGMQEVAIFGKLLGTVAAFGKWYYAEMGVMCLLASLFVGMFYRIKLKDRFAYMADGAKKMLRPALLVMFIYCVIYFAGNTMFYPTISYYILKVTSKFNIFFSTISMILGSALHVDILYVANYVVPQLVAQDANTTVLALLVQGIYGVTMFVAPTSALLALGLSYLEIPYKEWIKKTWILILVLLAIVLAVTILAMVI